MTNYSTSTTTTKAFYWLEFLYVYRHKINFFGLVAIEWLLIVVGFIVLIMVTIVSQMASRRSYIFENIKFQHIMYNPLKKRCFVPESGSELFIKNIPMDADVTTLAAFFDSIGEIFQIRLMMDDYLKQNRGFGYVTYMNRTLASKAKEELSRTPFKNVYLYIDRSLNNCRIFVGGIPVNKRKDQIWQELTKRGVKNIVDVIMYRSYSDRAENRGFVFVEFKTHEEAAYFRAKYAKNFSLFNKPAVVDWSVPVPDVEEHVLQTVKVLYIRNLEVCEPLSKFKELLYEFIKPEKVEKVYKFKNYAFVHLKTRKDAETLLIRLQEYFKNTVVEVVWSKPPNKYTSPEYRLKKVSSMSRISTTSINSCSPCPSPSSFTVESEFMLPPRDNSTPLSYYDSSNKLSGSSMQFSESPVRATKSWADSISPLRNAGTEESFNAAITPRIYPATMNCTLQHQKAFDDAVNRMYELTNQLYNSESTSHIAELGEDVMKRLNITSTLPSSSRQPSTDRFHLSSASSSIDLTNSFSAMENNLSNYSGWL